MSVPMKPIPEWIEEVRSDPVRFRRAFMAVWAVAYGMLLLGAIVIIWVLLYGR